MEQICNDNNFRNARNTGGLIDTTFNSKKFSFCSHDIYNIV